MSIGVKKNDVVIIALPNIPESIYCVYALNKLGAIADMIDLRTKGEALAQNLNFSGAAIAIICDLFAKNTIDVLSETHIQKLVVVSPFESCCRPLRGILKLKSRKLPLFSQAIIWRDFLKVNSNMEIHPVGKAEDVVCILHTSGTTDLPKGVMMSNYSFNAMSVQYRYCGIAFRACDRFLNQVPPFLAYNLIMATHLPLVLHMEVVMLPDYQPSKFAKNVMRLKPNHAIAGPADWSNFLENPNTRKADFSYLKTMASGSDTIQVKTKQLINELIHSRGGEYSILEGYGMTEIGSAACTNLPQCDVSGSVGIPLPKNIFCIYDNEAKRELPYYEVGEICMSGPTIMNGYWRNPKETENVLKTHEDGITWLHSGDFGYISEDGCVFFEGRLKRIIVRHDGIKVSPSTIEKTIMKHKNIKSCCVVGQFDKEHKSGQLPVAYYVLKETDAQTSKEIQELCERELSAKYLPQIYKELKSLPLTPNGKVDYRTLEKLAQEAAE